MNTLAYIEQILRDGFAFMLPLLIIAIGGLYSERSGVTNLALEGLLGFGAFIGALSVVLIRDYFFVAQLDWFLSHPLFLVLMAFFFSMIGGALYACLHALLCVKFMANQVISGVVVNILSISLTGFLVRQINVLVFSQPSDKFQLGVSPKYSVPGLSKIPVLGAFFQTLYPFQILILLLAGFMWFLLQKTRFGLHVQACGDNPHAVDAAGLHVQKIRFLSVIISGALAGLGGISFAYSISANFSSSIYFGTGYLAIAAMIFGNWKIGPTILACLLFGVSRSGGYAISGLVGSSAFTDIAMLLPYVLTLLLLVFFSSSNRAPRALGEIYDKGKR